MSEWYCLQTGSSQETKVAAGLAERNVPFFLPMQTELKDGQRHMSPCFPGYVWVLCELTDLGSLVGIEAVRGLFRYMANDGDLWPAQFPGSVILGLQIEERAGTFDFTRQVKPPKYQHRKGDTVRIVAGPYFDFVATVLTTPRSGRCKLLIQHESFTAPRKKTLDVAHLTAA